ncbi:hypothetical protein GOBAR_AA16051 [Gossypium barbadense]|uniref:BZIP domain-containing protein n=1 Tax=Gossypium barbadense TaxID=3634 RepID=A0A2P5XMN2_GOSBA|nr:hypothetical protein GOBAR_AA16051 [Gossypium barbadense]
MRLSPENNNSKRPGIPPSHPNNPTASLPYSQQIIGSRPNAQHGAPSHSKSLSQSTFFSLDRLPPWCPPPYRDPPVSSASDPASNDVSMEERFANSNVRSSLPSPVAGGCNEFRIGESSSLPPRKGHRRSSSDVPLGFSTMIQSLPQSIPIGNPGVLDRDMDSKASGTKTYGGESSDNEVDSRVHKHPINIQGMSSGVSSEKREGVKRRAAGDIAPTVRHYRSVSMDSYMGSLQFDEDTPKIPPSGNHGNHHSPGSSGDANSSKFNFELGSSEFNESELKKIMENEKLAEMASVDPKRVKRILANRQSAARSKQRKMQYIAELEQKVQTLQTEATTLSAQLTMLQRDSAGLTSQNNELKFRLQAMEQQAQLKDALNEALAAEVQRLKLTAAEFSGETSFLSSHVCQPYPDSTPSNGLNESIHFVQKGRNELELNCLSVVLFVSVTEMAKVRGYGSNHMITY